MLRHMNYVIGADGERYGWDTDNDCFLRFDVEAVAPEDVPSDVISIFMRNIIRNNQ